MTVKTLQSIRSDDKFVLFWSSVYIRLLNWILMSQIYLGRERFPGGMIMLLVLVIFLLQLKTTTKEYTLKLLI